MPAVYDLMELGEDSGGRISLKVVGIGGCGCNAITRMIQRKIRGVQYLAVNTDVQDFENCLYDEKLIIGTRVTRGRGTGGSSELGRQAAEENLTDIEDMLKGCDMVFISAGMGGGTGTGAAPVIAQVAREQGAITVGVVSRPFEHEGVLKQQRAEEGIQSLRKVLDSLIIIPNDRLLTVVDEDATLEDALALANDVLANAVEGINRIISVPGTINLDFEDVRRVITSGGGAMMGTGVATGPNRAEEAARQAISNPLLDSISIEGARAVLVNVHSSRDVKFREAMIAQKTISDVVGRTAQVFIGHSYGDDVDAEIKVTVIATGFGDRIENDPIEMDLPARVARGPFEGGRRGTEHIPYPVVAHGSGNVNTRDANLPCFLQRDFD